MRGDFMDEARRFDAIDRAASAWHRCDVCDEDFQGPTAVDGATVCAPCAEEMEQDEERARHHEAERAKHEAAYWEGVSRGE